MSKNNKKINEVFPIDFIWQPGDQREEPSDLEDTEGVQPVHGI